jgi:hypothetical protein
MLTTAGVKSFLDRVQDRRERMGNCRDRDAQDTSPVKKGMGGRIDLHVKFRGVCISLERGPAVRVGTGGWPYATLIGVS